MILYIDPGTGSMLITIVISLLGTALYFLRNAFMKLKFFAKGEKVDKNADKIPNGDGTESFIPNHNIYLAAFIAGLFIFLAVWGVSCLKKKNSTN